MKTVDPRTKEEVYLNSFQVMKTVDPRTKEEVYLNSFQWVLTIVLIGILRSF